MAMSSLTYIPGFVCFQSSSFEILGQLEPNWVEMLNGWSSKK